MMDWFSQLNLLIGAMSFDEGGSVSFDDDDLNAFRYRVRVSGETLSIWLEHRVSKAQWQTSDLQIKDCVVQDNMIPRADLVEYAQRFVNCLSVVDVEEQSEYSRTLCPVRKDGSYMLHLAIQLAVCGYRTQVDYDFVLLPIALERVDVLAAQVRDIDDTVQHMQTQIVSLVVEKKRTLLQTSAATIMSSAELSDQAEKDPELAFIQLKSTRSMTQCEVFSWSVAPERSSHFLISLYGGSVFFGVCCIYLITIHFQHNSSHNGALFAFLLNGVEIEAIMNYNSSGHAQTVSHTFVHRVQRVYKGSSLTIVEQR